MAVHRILEIACFNLESARVAQAAGADRIELCDDYAAGGITPSETLIASVVAQVQIPVHVMIRPREGNFVYSAEEVAEMENSIQMCKKYRVSGLVFGALTPENEIDLAVCKRLCELARPLSVTFHRAIDQCNDLKRSVTGLVHLKVDRLLSSGRGSTALEGVMELMILQKIFGRQIIIMPGGGVRAANLARVFASGCSEYHTAALTSGEVADAAEIKAMKAAMNASIL